MPVAVQVEHDPSVAPSDAPAEQHCRYVVRASHEHGVRREVAQLARDTQGQREVKRDAVQQTWSHRLDEVERLVVRQIRASRAGEHAHVCNAVKRIELLARRVR